MQTFSSSSPLSADVWMRDVFGAKQVAKGGVIRRTMRDIETYVGRDAFEAEIRRRGFRAIENTGHVIVICNQAPIRQVV